MKATRFAPVFLAAARVVAAAAGLSAGSAVVCAHAASAGAAAPPDTMRFVVHVSVDGLRADAVARLGAEAAPHFWRFRIEGALTENARTDYDYTITLPNHVSQLTGRPVLGPNGHGVSFNTDDPRTLEQVHGSYVAGVFDVVHDEGLRTACYASKTKFDIFDRSWNGANGAPDTTGADDGRDKIDTYLYNASTTALVSSFLGGLETRHEHYVFLHVVDPDGVGHSYGWESRQYFDAIIKIDGFLGQIYDLIEADPILADRTWLLVTSDHGGVGYDHGLPGDPANYTIPLYLWGPGIPAGADLYEMNASSRLDPGTGRPDHAASPQPIRNAEAGNIALGLLGLRAIPGSTFDAAQDFVFTPAGGLPGVSITSPSPGASFPYPSVVLIEAEADGGTLGIDRVEFYANNELVCADPAAPYSCAWSTAPLGIHRITARAVRGDGIASATGMEIEITTTADAGVAARSSPLPKPLVYPNPCGGLATFSFALDASADVEIALYDPLGRRVGTVHRGRLGRGAHEITFDAGRHPPGPYFYRLVAGREVRSGTVMIVR